MGINFQLTFHHDFTLHLIQATFWNPGLFDHKVPNTTYSPLSKRSLHIKSGG